MLADWYFFWPQIACIICFSY